MVSLFNGSLHLWNYDTQQMVKSFEVGDVPVRCAIFVVRKNWIVAGADDMHIRVHNYNTMERVHKFEAHSDYLRCLAAHPTQPYLLSSSDDMSIKLWDWDKKWQNIQTFEGHGHYVMQIVINPKDNNQFASASLDKTVKVWQFGANQPNFTLEGHEKGVNCVDYYSGGDKPYLISGGDDRLVKIWDYQNKSCVQTLDGHAHNISAVKFHPHLPIILTGSEDGTLRLWHANTYRLETTLNYGMERVWSIACAKNSNHVAIGYDEGSIMIRLGRDEPAMSMDSSGKIIWAKHSEIQQANLNAVVDVELKDGEKVPLAVKDMGSSEVYPQIIKHSPNGRFVAVCGDGEFSIYTAMALRNKAFGSGLEFVWSSDSAIYAVREQTTVKIFKNFKEKTSLKPELGVDGIFGGNLLGVRSTHGLAFYDWDDNTLIRRIEIMPKLIIWSESGEMVCIATDESYFVLKYSPEAVSKAMENKAAIPQEGVEEAFEVVGEISEVVKTGIWVGDCFIYTNNVNRLNYFVGGEIVTISHLDREMYLLGYIAKDNRLYLGDKEHIVVSYSVLLSVLQYQTHIMRKDFHIADQVLPSIPREHRTRVANFLEKQGFKPQALTVTTDPEHKFELSLQLGDLKTAYHIARESESQQKWKQLADLAIRQCQFGLAQECLHHAQDYAGLLLLATSAGQADQMAKLAGASEKSEINNVAFYSYFLLGKLDECLDILINTNRLPEAAFFARTYLPSQISRVVQLWKGSLSKSSQKSAEALADPMQYENLFPTLQEALHAEQYLQVQSRKQVPAKMFPSTSANWERNVMEEASNWTPCDEDNQQTPTAAAVTTKGETEDNQPCEIMSALHEKEKEEEEFQDACVEPSPYSLSHHETVDHDHNIESSEVDKDQVDIDHSDQGADSLLTRSEDETKKSAEELSLDDDLEKLNLEDGMEDTGATTADNDDVDDDNDIDEDELLKDD